MRKILSLLIIFAVSTPLLAADFVEVVTEELKPLNYLENGKIKGSATKIVRKVLDKAGVTYHIAMYPWARAYLRAQKVENVVIYTINRTPDREGLFKWIGLVTPPYELTSPYNTSLYKLKGNDSIVAKTLQEAKLNTVAVVNKDVNYDFLKAQGFTKLTQVGTRS
jgi:polar amino acid transport system substrate-binding protein